MLRYLWPVTMVLALAFSWGCALDSSEPDDDPPVSEPCLECNSSGLIGGGWSFGEAVWATAAASCGSAPARCR